MQRRPQEEPRTPGTGASDACRRKRWNSDSLANRDAERNRDPRLAAQADLKASMPSLAWPGSFLAGRSLPPVQPETGATRECASQQQRLQRSRFQRRPLAAGQPQAALHRFPEFGAARPALGWRTAIRSSRKVGTVLASRLCHSVSPASGRSRRGAESIAKWASRRRSSSTSGRRCWASSSTSSGCWRASVARREISAARLRRHWPGCIRGPAQFPAERLVGVEHRAGAQGHGADLGAPRMQAGADLAAEAGLAAAFTRQLGFRFWHGSSWDWGG